jgi:hypothetical protein
MYEDDSGDDDDDDDDDVRVQSWHQHDLLIIRLTCPVPTKNRARRLGRRRGGTT